MFGLTAHRLLFICARASIVALIVLVGPQYLGIDGVIFPDGSPFGADFVNLWTTARLLLEGQSEIIYQHAAYAAYQMQWVGKYIDHRLWAYPSHSLLFMWPFGLLPYAVSFLVFSLLGLGVLFIGCRSLGLSRDETLIVMISPATITCLHNGQTGLFATGLLLLALCARHSHSRVVSALVLTLKPQMGVFIPLVWIKEKRWFAIGATALGGMGLVGLTVWLWGWEVVELYLHNTLPELSVLERFGIGIFTLMIPSLFMSLRVLGVDGDTAISVHIAVALVMGAVVVWRLWRTEDVTRRIGQLLSGTALLTPYIHQYDLNIVLVAALLMLRRYGQEDRHYSFAVSVAALAIMLPLLVMPANLFGVPIGPVVLFLVWLLS